MIVALLVLILMALLFPGFLRWVLSLIALLFVGAILVGMAHAQTADPYADLERDQKMKEYHEYRASLMQETEYLSFALECKVLPAPVYISLIINSMVEHRFDPIIDTHIPQLRQEAAQRGVDKAKASGGCDYWKQHPEEVVAVRQQAVRSSY